MAFSIFTDISITPDDKTLSEVLSVSFVWWNDIKGFVFQQYPKAIEEWKYSGKNYGWGFRLKDKKRAIIYLTPAEGFFMASLVFGEKATQQIMQSSVSEEIKKNIREARVYAEGRGIRIEVKNAEILGDIKKLISVKLQN